MILWIDIRFEKPHKLSKLISNRLCPLHVVCAIKDQKSDIRDCTPPENSRKKLPRHRFIGGKNSFYRCAVSPPRAIFANISATGAAGKKMPDCFTRTIGNFPFTKTTQFLWVVCCFFRNRFRAQKKNFNMFCRKWRRLSADGRWLRSCTKENLQT